MFVSAIKDNLLITSFNSDIKTAQQSILAKGFTRDQKTSD